MGLKQEEILLSNNSINSNVGEIPIDKQKLAAPIKSALDKYQLVPEFLKVRGLVKQHLDSFNYFVNTGIKKIVCANDMIVSDVDPVFSSGLKMYAAPILVNIEYTQGSRGVKMRAEKNDLVIGRMPIMLRSCCCVLYGKDEAELARLGECPLDPGGYFIIKGTDKVMLIQEQLSKNRIIIDADKKGNINASVTSSSEATKSKTVIQMEKEKIYLLLNQFVKKIPIMVVMKAMGMESDQEVVQMLGRDPRYSALLLPSIEECAGINIYTQEQALQFLEAKLKRSMYADRASEKEGRALSILRVVFLANVPVRSDNFRPKCLYVAVMLRRMMDAILNKDAMDDKAKQVLRCHRSYLFKNSRSLRKHKRLCGEQASGAIWQLISLLFEDLFKTTITEVKRHIDTVLSKPSRSSALDPSLFLRTKEIITGGLERTLSTGNFDIKCFRMHRKGMTQVLARLSFIGTLGYMTKIQPQFEKSRKVSGPRALQPSQCYSLGVEDLELLSGEELHTPNSFLVILNGLILGKHRRPQHFAVALRKLRRAGKVGEFVSVFVNEKQLNKSVVVVYVGVRILVILKHICLRVVGMHIFWKLFDVELYLCADQLCVYIASDGGRVCRPLVIADKGISRIKEHHMKELLDGVRSFDDFLRHGLIEYLDVNEENNALIALYEGEATPDTTHIEIEPFTILGVCAGLIPYPHHNQSPRNTYQCAMGKQAMGNIAYNQLNRMDTLLYLLVHPQRPLLTTRTIELNATVAVMSYSGYDIEDAIVMNKSSLDRGFGRCIVMKRYSGVIQKYDNGASDRILRPQRTGVGSEKMQILDDDGIAAPGEIIRPDDVYINKQSPVITRGSRITSAEPLPDKVALSSDRNENPCIKILIRHTRRPEVGDKFSSRHGQKGVCGTIIQQEDFPFSERGICPDLIMDPHGFPSRMTVGKMIELLGGKAGVSCGRFHYGSAFGEPSGHADKVEAISETLIKHGFSYNGKDFLYSGSAAYALSFSLCPFLGS
ncbi:hypothetical protein COLO4_05983 [Corchorus olitorius]|uniref:DNA-directed RNA polymerase subunit beta n=1 Tax=Corchorus olitorius TaxID=93759 RepID=A0A1R3KPI3_9ROSI|nr:hypothetical protein COLO4_05983 [Corchorus olitorius]